MHPFNLIYFLSAYPGGGKSYAIQLAIIKLFAEHYPTHIIVAAFPTVALLEQFFNDILKRNTKYADRVRIVRTQKDEDRYIHARQHLEHRDIIEEKNSKILSGTTTEQMTLHMVGQRGDDYQKGVEMIPDGHVILTTHATIINLPSTFKGQQRIELMFDEARDCLQGESEKEVKIPDAVYQALREYYITTHRHQVLDDDGNPTGNFFEQWNWKSRDPAPTIDRLKTIWEKSTKIKWTAKRSKLLHEFLQHVANGRLEAWIAFNSSSEENGEMVFTFNTLLSPAHLFYGFKKVTIFAAFFESSQMYHVLKHRQSLGYAGRDKNGLIKWKPATLYQDRVELKDANVNGQKLDPERVKIIRDGINKRCWLVPLFCDFPSDGGSPLAFSLSKEHIKNGIVVRPRDYSALHTEYHEHHSKLRWQTRYDRWNALDENKERDPHDQLPVPKLKPLPQYSEAIQHAESTFNLIIKRHTKHSKTRPILYAAAKACQIYEAWNASLPKKWKCKKPLLLTTNVTYDKRTGRTFDDEFKITRTLGERITYMPPMQQGINGFMEYQAAAFLATLKLTPAQAALMNYIAPTYDPTLDRTVDVCIQFLLRVNIRQAFDDAGNPQARPCLFIVTDRTLAEGVAKQLGAQSDEQEPVRIPIVDPADIVDSWKPATILTFVPDSEISERDEERLKVESTRRQNSSSTKKASKTRYDNSFGERKAEYEKLKKQRTRLLSELKVDPQNTNLKKQIIDRERMIAKIQMWRKSKVVSS